jgi:HAD superfamily hydrolase (TIGR01509 family)
LKESSALPSQPVQLVICDCDGVIVDSEILAEQVLLDVLGVHAPRADIELLLREGFGLSSEAILKLAEGRFGVTLSPEFAAEVRARTDALIAESVQPIAGVKSALEQIDLPLCVVSNSFHPSVVNSIRRAGLTERVAGKIFSADMVAHPKPAPDLYLLASASMGVAPERCVAIEDSLAGVKAALAAGARVIGFVGASHVPPTHAATLLEIGVVAVVKHMTELPALVRTLQ